MSTRELLPKPVEAVLERGIGIREFRAWPSGHAWLDTFYDAFVGSDPDDADNPEHVALVKAIFKHRAEVLQIQDELWDTLAAHGCEFDDYVLAACMIDGSLVIAGCLINIEEIKRQQSAVIPRPGHEHKLRPEMLAVLRRK
jgi:hypothetical protein